MPDRESTAAADFAMPEFTRALRGLASANALGRAEHTSVFGPLLAARKLAEHAGSARARVAAFDAARLKRACSESIESIAAARVPKAGADRRALTARLTEQGAAMFAAVASLELSAGRVRLAGDIPDSHSWSEWLSSVQSLFDAADRFWFTIEPELGPRAPLKKKGRGAAARAVALAMIALGAITTSAQAQHATVRVAGVSPDSLRARGFDVVGMDRGAPLVVADPAQLAKMEARGWHGAMFRAASAPALSPTGISAQTIVATQVYRDYDDPARGVRAFIDSMVKNNPRVSVDTLGLSLQGRPMLAVKIGAKDDSPQRPNVLYMATYHAREWAATEMALRLIKYLAAPPGSNPRVDSLVQTRDIWILPVANPDGYEYTFTNDRLWRKTRSPQAGGAVGVDMNRNHRQNWGLDEVGSSSDPTSDIYRGTSPASEIEVRNIEAFHAAHPPVISISYHTYAGLLLFSPSAVYGQLSSDLPVYRTLAGTNQRPAVKDNLQGSARSYDSPNTSWTLYTTNGEYNDWASAKYGALSFTPEISSGYQNGSYYGFEFPDNEAQLQQLFSDNLPFAIDALESARDPLAYVSPTTFFHTDRVVLESVSPTIQATVPAAMASSASISSPNPLSFRVDSLAAGKYTRRIVAAAVRPTALSIGAGGQTANFSVLGINGAELTETGWTATQFIHDSTFAMVGKYSWYTSGGGDLKSPAINVPTDADTVSLVFWTRYGGSGFTELPFGDVNLSVDGGASFQRVMRLEGFAPIFYPEQVTIGGVKGKHLVFDFVPNGLPWSLDEIAVVSHGAVTSSTTAASGVLIPSENPVHHNVVYFPWPFVNATGDILAYDFSGRLVWKASVTAAGNVAWDLNAGHVANGVYVVIARSGSKTLRLKLFVVRNGS
jgi:Zinc carboxypeptidase